MTAPAFTPNKSYDLLRQFFIVMLYAVVSISPYLTFINVTSGFNFGDLIVVLLAIILALATRRGSYASLLPLLFFVLGVLSAYLNFVFGDYQLTNLPKVFKWAYFVFLVFVTSKFCITARGRKSIILGVYIGLVFSTFMTWYVWSSKPTYLGLVPMLHSLDESGVVLNRNFISYYTAAATGLAAAYSFSCRKIIWRIINIVLWVLLVVTTLLTFSKGGWITAIMVSLLVYVVSVKPSVIRLGTCLVFIFTFLVFFSVFFSDFSGEIVERVIERVGGSEGTNQHRLLFVVQAVQLFLFNPLVGVGPGGYRSAAVSYGFESTSDPHNAILWVAVELGMFAFIIVAALLIVVVRHFYREAKSRLDAVGYYAIAVVVLLSVPLHGLPVSSKFLWILLGAMSSNLVYKAKVRGYAS